MAQPEEGKVEGKINGENHRESGVTPPTAIQTGNSPSTIAPTLKRANTTPQLSTTSLPPISTTPSPQTSREGSPTRPSLNPAKTVTPRATRSRKNSQDLSPGRAPSASGSNIPSVPSAAAIQRALSATGASHLPAPTKPDIAVDAPRPQKPNKPSIGGAQQAGSHIPRLTSPPPSASSGSNKSVLSGPRKIDQSHSAPTAPTIVVEQPSRSSTFAADSDAGEEDQTPKVGMRTATRGGSGTGPPLETVQESSLPATPSIGTKPPQTAKAGDRPERIDENPMEEAFGKEQNSKVGSGNESAGNKSGDSKINEEGKEKGKPSTVVNNAKPPMIQAKKSFSQLPFTKGKTASEGSVKNMTVETETVSSIPQVALGGGAGERNALGRTETNGSLRLKPSTETIRPKKDKKKAARKAPSLNSGTGGFLSKRCHHHHHIYSRPPSPEFSLHSSSASSDFTRVQSWEHERPDSALLSGNSMDKHEHLPSAETSPPKFRGPPRRASSILIPFRGRSASSKADIFEAKVASAVDQTNSSDSEETFVYESTQSNPSEPLSGRPHRFHSRTPSATSTASQIDHYGAKGRQDGLHSVVGKKSMKFANNYNSIGYGHENDATVRGTSQQGRTNGGNTIHHHHIGRYGRGGHTSLFDSDSPFPNATKASRSSTNNLNLSPRNGSPRSPHVIHVTKSPRKAEELSYDLEGEGADDERAPLIGSMRIGRNRRRPLPGSVRPTYSEDNGHRFCSRVTAFTILGSVLTLLIAAIVAICILTSKILLDVHINRIENVLASEQELMLDLHVHAINPNIIGVQISDIDLDVFAKSKHAGTSELWRSRRPHIKHPHNRASSDYLQIPSRSPKDDMDPSDRISQLDGIDEGADPIDDDDPASDSRLLKLGNILEFDSPLVFDPSPVRHHMLGSIGQIRLDKPGNGTNDGGMRWEHVIEYDFELIVRGTLKYSTPISSSIHTILVAGRTIVHPSDGLDDAGNMRLSRSSWRGDPGSNVLLERPRKGLEIKVRLRN